MRKGNIYEANIFLLKKSILTKAVSRIQEPDPVVNGKILVWPRALLLLLLPLEGPPHLDLRAQARSSTRGWAPVSCVMMASIAGQKPTASRGALSQPVVMQ